MAKKTETVVTVEKKTVKHNGVNVTIPLFTEKNINNGIIRKTRHLSDEEKGQEIMWLMFEALLTPEELAVVDALAPDDLAAVIEKVSPDLPK